jgi:hypothetical protein
MKSHRTNQIEWKEMVKQSNLFILRWLFSILPPTIGNLFRLFLLAGEGPAPDGRIFPAAGFRQRTPEWRAVPHTLRASLPLRQKEQLPLWRI